MDLCDYYQVRALLEQTGFHFSRSKSQNFLSAAWVPEEMVRRADLSREDGVVEIGPGVGCLTEKLAEKAGKVLAYEVDLSLRPVLTVTLAGLDNVEVFFADVMSRELAQDVQRELLGLHPLVCANLPYHITTPVLTKLYRSRCFEKMILMVQKEVAQRLCARAGDREYGSLSLLTQWYARSAGILFTVPPECFIPRPKVSSAVVRLEMRDSPPSSVEEENFFAVVRAAFNQRRKTLSNALSGLRGKQRACEALQACGLDPEIRGENLTLEQFAQVADTLFKGEKDGT